MNEYYIEWSINLEADTPEEAAQLALDAIRDPQSLAVVFTVTDRTGHKTQVDLLEVWDTERRLQRQQETGRCGWCGRLVLECVCD